MKKDEVLFRLREEMDAPHLTIKLEDKDYSEEEYEKLKADLIKYFDDYVRNVEN